MNVSKTELTALLKQVFEALGFAPGETESAADMVIWAQMSGLQGLRELAKALPGLLADDRDSIELVSENNTHAVFDAHDASCLSFADTAMSLACVKALSQDFCSVTVLNCHNRAQITKAVLDCGRRGMGALVYWRDTQDAGAEHVLSAPAEDTSHGQLRYTINRVEKPGNIGDANRQSLSIYCSSHHQHLEGHRSSVFRQQQETLTVFDQDNLRSNYQSALSRGLAMEIDLWSRLKELSLTVLVESSEKSRMGAGA